MRIFLDEVLFTVYFLTLALILSGCASAPPVIFPHTPDHAGALRVTEIMDLVSGKEFSEEFFQVTKDNSGFSDMNIRQGAMAAGRMYCCGGPNEMTNIAMIFVPQEVSVNLGDIVEVKMGKAPERGKPGIVNIATRVREKHDGKYLPKWGSSDNGASSSCRWIPERPNLWGRILYCDWMKEEGWIEYDGFWETWMKPQK
jgi:hypothetical protein